MTNDERIAQIFDNLKELNQFIEIREGTLLNMENGCEVTLIKEFAGSGGFAFALPQDPAIKLAWGENKYSLELEAAEKFLTLMKV